MVVEVDLVLFQVRVELVGAEDLGNLDELVVIVVAVEKWLLAEDLCGFEVTCSLEVKIAPHHAGEHTPQRPHVEAVVVLLEVDEELGTLEVP
jgi:hypothetical protein